MSAYNSNFVSQLPIPAGGSGITWITATLNPAYVEIKELLVAGGEIVMAGEEFDIVEQVTERSPLTIALEFTTTSPSPNPTEGNQGGTTQTPYPPVGTEPGQGTPPPVIIVPPEEAPPPIVDPILGVDPLWASVQAMSWMNSPAGTTGETAINKCLTMRRWREQDVNKGTFLFLGNQWEIISGTSLPYLGNTTVKCPIYQRSGYVDISPFYMITTGGECNASTSPQIGGNFTAEFVVAADSSAPYIKATMYYDDYTKFIKLNLGNQGAVAGVPIPAQATILHTLSGLQTATTATPDSLQLLHYYHLCIERVGLVVSIYLDGALIAQTTQTETLQVRGQAIVEARYISQARFTVGNARYNGSVSIPSALFANS